MRISVSLWTNLDRHKVKQIACRGPCHGWHHCGDGSLPRCLLWCSAQFQKPSDQLPSLCCSCHGTQLWPKYPLPSSLEMVVLRVVQDRCSLYLCWAVATKHQYEVRGITCMDNNYEPYAITSAS